MKIVIIDYGAGNIQSLKFAIQRLGLKAVLSHDAKEINAADKVIFPGVGNAGSAMEKLKSTGLDRLIPKLQQPVLGICLGMQLMCSFSEEGKTEGLSIFPTCVKRFPNQVKVPHIGWNRVNNLTSGLFTGIDEGEFMYMVHSFYAEDCPQKIAETTYGLTYSSALEYKNFYGVQFHPEKSSAAGERLLHNFLTLTSP